MILEHETYHRASNIVPQFDGRIKKVYRSISHASNNITIFRVIQVIVLMTAISTTIIMDLIALKNARFNPSLQRIK